MTSTDNSPRRPETSSGQRPLQGWTAVHSWVFLVIVAVGLTFIVLENRWHYLSPLGLGKAYRIDRLFGSIQEFDPSGGWVTAQIEPGMAPSGGPPEPSTVPVPMQMPGMRTPETMPPQPRPMTETFTPPPGAPREEAPSTSPRTREAPPQERRTAVETLPGQKAGDSQEDRWMSFHKAFPDFGEEEFQLANDDLFPDWKKKIAANGTWPQFLKVYGEFIQWWTGAGSPPEPGLKLWQDFIATKRR
jgi:hypothetical protein